MVRRRVGRPMKAPSELLVPVTLRLEPGLYEEICRRAREDAITASEALRRLVRRVLSAQ